ncbi:MAG: hypothetical protein H7Y15_00795 [Pseudonocardia sp.]|nr:hypothetical protein [Pseudonocardia sp.]
MNLLPREEWNRFFGEFEHTTFRLEVRERYNVPYEAGELERFLGDGRFDPGPYDWLRQVRAAVRAGRTYRRVRVVSVPLSDYSRFGVATAAQTNAAGEDIRYLERGEAGELGVPLQHDWWLFDSHRLLRLHFDDDDRLLGGELVTDPVAVVEANRVRDLAWHHAWLREIFNDR